MIKKILITVALILIAIQFIPVDRSNPPVIQDINPPQNVSEILRTSCYDCHSNETVWPWYSYVAPVSFLVSGDVKDGRKRINFSEWNKYDEKKQIKKMNGILEVIQEGEMPLSNYLLMHSEAKMDAAKIQAVKDWVSSSTIKDEPVRYNKEDEKD